MNSEARQSAVMTMTRGPLPNSNDSPLIAGKLDCPEARVAPTSSIGHLPAMQMEEILSLHVRGMAEAWDHRRFRVVSRLQECPRNSGIVELCKDLARQSMVAVKAMPVSWVCADPEAFLRTHPHENELPWRDIGATSYLSRHAGVAGVCDFVGLYVRPSDEHGQELCLVMSYCAGGDLFSWMERGQHVSIVAREAKAKPIFRKVLETVRDVHAVGLAHGDLSLENVLLATKVADDVENVKVKLIDFGMCTGPQAKGVRGKKSYQPPEMWFDQDYDAQAADVFALGIMLFALVTGDYPWQTTRPSVCPFFKYVAAKGFPAYLVRRKVKIESPEGERVATLAEILSPALISFLSVCLAVKSEARPSAAEALEHPWLAA